MARKSKYKLYVEPYLKQIEEWISEGDYEYQICKKLGVSVSQWEEYKIKHAILPEAIKKGKQNLDADLEKSLFKRAKGFYYDDTYKGQTVKKYIPPSETALIFALCNRNPDKWKRHDKDDIRDKDININIKFEEDDD